MGNHVVLAFLCGEVSDYWFTLLTINQSIHVFFFFVSDTFWIGCMFFFSNFIFLFFNFTILYWFCHISTWIHHRFIRVPHPKPSSLPVPSLYVVPVQQPQASSTVHWTWTGDSFLMFFLRIFPFILVTLVCCYIVAHSRLLWFLVILGYIFNL